MKNTISTGLVLICLGLATFGQKAVRVAQELSYTIDFVFSGEIPSKGDMEAKKETGQVRVLVYKYDKYDLQIPILREDCQGVKHVLRLKTNAGQPSATVNPIIKLITKPIL